jgi:hypothetical protein
MKTIKRFVGIITLGLFLVSGVHAADHTFSGPDSWGDIKIAGVDTPFDTTWTIDLTVPLNMTITFATYVVAGQENNSGVYDTAFEILDSSSTSLFSGTITGPSGFATFVDMLAAGTYTLRMQSIGGIAELGGSYSVNAVSSVPLPAAVLLFGSTLAGFGLFRRRRSVA